MGKEQATLVIDARWPWLTPLEKEFLLARIPKMPSPQKDTGGNYDEHARFFCLIAWLAGASIRQLARVYGIRPSSMSDKLNRVMVSKNRSMARLDSGPLDDLMVYTMKELYYIPLRDNPRGWDHLNYVEIAKIIKSMAQLTIVEDKLDDD